MRRWPAKGHSIELSNKWDADRPKAISIELSKRDTVYPTKGM